MKQYVLINDVPIELDIPDSMTVTYSGSKENYRIEYGNDLVEVGGIISANFTETVEVITSQELPFKNLLDCQCSPLDVVGEYQEKSHLQIMSDNLIRIYGQVKEPYTGIMKIKWMAKGVI